MGRHRRRPAPGQRGRRCELAAIPVGSLPGVPAEAFVNDVKADLFHAPTPSTWPSTTTSPATSALPAAEHRPRPQLALDRRRPARPAPGLAGGPGPRPAGASVRGHRVRPLLHPRRRRALGRAHRRRAHHLLPRPRHPAPRERPGRRLLRPRPLRPRRLLAAARGVGPGASARRSLFRGAAGLVVPSSASTLGGRGAADQGAADFVAPNPPFGAVFTYPCQERWQPQGGAPGAARSRARPRGRTPRTRAGTSSTRERARRRRRCC